MTSKSIITKNKIYLFIGAIIVILILLLPFRYKITGTSKGYLYKTDRLTGKTWVVSPSGEKEIGEFKTPTPTQAPRQFPINYLQIVSLTNKDGDSTTDISSYAVAVVKNTYTSTASNVKYKVVYSKTKDSSPFDTRYHDSYIKIPPGDTVTVNIPLYNSSQMWYTVEIVSAEY
jgi:hypothetical protein